MNSPRQPTSAFGRFRPKSPAARAEPLSVRSPDGPASWCRLPCDHFLHVFSTYPGRADGAAADNHPVLRCMDHHKIRTRKCWASGGCWRHRCGAKAGRQLAIGKIGARESSQRHPCIHLTRRREVERQPHIADRPLIIERRDCKILPGNAKDCRIITGMEILDCVPDTRECRVLGYFLAARDVRS